MSLLIRIEDKIHFYNETPSLQLDNVNHIQWSYDKSHIFKTVQIGYQRSLSESEGGLDDPQTSKTLATLFYQVGEDISLLSKFFAAALAMEEARRRRTEETRDYRLDEEIMIVALNETISPSYYSPELNENFTDITGINNSGSRYNLRLTPAWNFLRWIYYFRGCLQSYTDSDFKFTKAEGNYEFSARMDDDSDCILFTEPLVAENMDIPVSIGNAENYFLHLPDQWEFKKNLSWDEYKTIRNNRKNAILVSPTDTDHKICFIDTLEYDPHIAEATFKVWLGGRTAPFEEGEASPPVGEFGDFVLAPQYGMSITNIVGSGVPVFTYPVSSTESESFSSTIPAQTLQVDLSGTRIAPITLNIALYVDNILVDCENITTDGAQTKYLVLPGSVSVPSDIRISIGLGSC